MPALQFRPLALEDLRLAALWYRNESGIGLANRFLDSVEATAALIASRPGIGSPCLYANPELSGLRRWPVKGFERWIFFYLPSAQGVQVARVLHGARNLDEIFAGEPSHE